VFSPDNPRVNGTWVPLTECYNDTYVRDSTYGITFAPDMYEKDDVRSVVQMWLALSSKTAGPRPGETLLRAPEAMLLTGQVESGCLDNSAFLMKLVAFYATQWDDPGFLCAHEPELAALFRWNLAARDTKPPSHTRNPRSTYRSAHGSTLGTSGTHSSSTHDTTPYTAGYGLWYLPGGTCGYGFIDSVGLPSGHNLFMSLLFVESARAAADALQKAQCHLTVPLTNYTAEATRTANAVSALLFNDDVGMFHATDVEGEGYGKTDVFGSVFAAALGVGSAEQRDAVSKYMTKHSDIVFAWGQVSCCVCPRMVGDAGVHPGISRGNAS
jgi:hypothetical protein